MDKKWTALVPQRSLVSSKTGKPLLSARAPRLIGRLPEDAYLQLYLHIGLGDIVNLARCCRKVAALARDERVWRRKLALLDYRGPEPEGVERLKLAAGAAGALVPTSVSANKNGAIAAGAQAPPSPSAPSTLTRSGSTSKRNSHAPKTSISSTNKRSGYSVSNARSPVIPEDDASGFGDFIDSANAFDTNPSKNSINGHFASIELDDPFAEGTSSTATPKKPKRKEEDLLMLFDDEEDMGLATATPAKLPSSSQHTRNTSTATNGFSSSSNNGHARTSSISKQIHLNSPSPSHDLFVAYYRFLLPYYNSLKLHSTTSLIFTSPHLTPLSRGQLLSTLHRLVSHPEISPPIPRSALFPTSSSSSYSSYSSNNTQSQSTIIKRNLQSSIDHFHSSTLSSFQKAADENLHSGMRESAAALWELPTAGRKEVVEVFLEKIPLFWDQSWDPLKNLTQQLGPSGEMVDGIDFSAMDSFMNHVLAIVSREGKTIARVFPPDSDVLVQFADRISNDVISEYIVPLLGAAQDLPNPLFLLTTAATFGQCSRLIDVILSITPSSSLVTRPKISSLVYNMFEPHMSLYLSSESSWNRSLLSSICTEWDTKLASANASASAMDPTFLNAQNPQMVKRNVLANFGKALLLPVTIVPKTVVFGVNAITYGGTMAFNVMSGGLIGSNSASTASAGKAGSPVNGFTAIDTNNMDSLAITRPERQRTASTTSLPGTPTGAGAAVQRSGSIGSLDFAGFQMLLSIETAMQLIQADRDCLKRIQTFEGYSGKTGQNVRKGIEDIFISLCQTLSISHLQPAFAKATDQMGNYKPADHAVNESVAPLVQFFELVHIGDTIAQMVQVYYDREMAKYVDRNDFLSVVVREKKKFENALDESVASGLNAGLSILMTQAEYILQTQQDPRDFCPDLAGEEGSNGRRGSAQSSVKGNNGSGSGMGIVDIEGPTRAARAVVECLRSHCDMLKGSTDKAILEVFHQEVGLRLHGMLLKHFTKSIVSIPGGFQVIADLNLYTSFISSLKLPAVQPYFNALKMASNVYIISSPKDLGMMARDLDRYEGTLRIEDIMEMVKCRTDWKRIEREVEKEVFGFKAEDCTVQ